jgi:nitrogenase iron protein NifH
MAVRQIAIYGKGGIGKSTVSGNVAMAMAILGRKVLLIGCDPKQDTTLALNQGVQLPSVLEVLYEKGEDNVKIDDVCTKGPNGVILVEAGGPEPGVGCAGRGVITALELLEKLKVIEAYGIDTVIYDVLGDVVCGGFAMPLRTGHAKEIYLVTSGELMAMFAANNICKAISRFASNMVDLGLGGIILNKRNVPKEVELVSTLADNIGSSIIEEIPRSKMIQISEAEKKTVMEMYPDSDIAKSFIKLANSMLHPKQMVVPTAMAQNDLRNMIAETIESSEILLAETAIA